MKIEFNPVTMEVHDLFKVSETMRTLIDAKARLDRQVSEGDLNRDQADNLFREKFVELTQDMEI